MTHVWAIAALWLGLALVATLMSIWFKIATALSEIVVGTIAQLIIGAAVGSAVLGTQESWVTFLSGAGAIVLTFLAGAELDPSVFRTKWKEATAVGLAGFTLPFVGCTLLAVLGLGWTMKAALLAGVAMSTTSVAVVYAVMLEFGLNRTDYGKTLLAACFINDLVTVLALGVIFAPFTVKTAIFAGIAVVVFVILPWLTPRFFKLYGDRPSELEAKFLLLALFGLGALATWADSEAVLPAYLVGMVLAGTVGKDHALIRRLRTLTFGLLTPFYFIRAGSFVSLSALWAAPIGFLVLLIGKMASKVVGVYPLTRWFASPRKEAAYTTLLMSTGLTFGTISALFGLSHHVIDQSQYSILVATVIGSAIVPTLIANAFYLPRHLIPPEEPLPDAQKPEAAPQVAAAVAGRS
ncbi:MAG: cation:proton antiporter [Pseudomonadota bacterium]|jgi:glutathione-regulated potassium-efflux system ancillary protein KefC|uniref:cation:proton antiporter n=1 Tax=Sphingomonadales TaxID=204457 RepID=UPI00087273D6|nr:MULTISPECIES: cation:proton antiporter [Sphingomonadaceae]OJY51737.1 MAG: potassium transporter Kef [Sphingomonas sp. 67-41]VVT18044.1 Potassium transporter Kef [Sphingomonas sp. EC-HK361]